MLIAQISDLHISVPGVKTYGIAPMAENLQRCIAHINGFAPQPEMVLVTGDISNAGLAAEFEYAAKLLGQLQMPYYLIPGNHDDRTGLWSTFGGRACPDRAGGFIQYVIERERLRIIAMDSTHPGEPGGQICAARAAWLDSRLAEDLDTPCVICMHHPPVKCGVIETDIDGFDGADLVGDVVQKYRHIEAIICGHIHTPAHTRWRGTVVSTAPSMGMQLVLDFALVRDEFVLQEPAYQLHYWTPQKNLITHTVSLPACDAAYRFEQQPANS